MITGLGSVKDLASGKRGAFYNTLEEFHKHWERIDIIAPKIKDQNLEIKEFFGNVYVHISSWPLIFHPIWFIRKGIDIYREQKFDLMTVQEFPPFYNGIGARLLWNKIKVPYILEIMHIVGHPKASGIKERVYKLLIKLFIRFDSSKVKAVRVINKKETPEFLIKAGIPKEKLVYIPAFYIDLNVFRPRNLNKEYDLIFIGRLVKNKGLDLLLKIAKKTDYKILVVGTGPLHNYLKLQIENHKLKINLCGWAKDSSEICGLINKSKALLMLSDNEGGPRVVLEALACGVPVIATPVGIVPDIINHNNGRIINWSVDEAIEAFKEIRDIKIAVDLSPFEREKAIKNYADSLKELIQ